jgi:hypothetical protein
VDCQTHTFSTITNTTLTNYLGAAWAFEVSPCVAQGPADMQMREAQDF